MSYEDIVVNHNDVDPISLEKINKLAMNNVFLVTNKITKQLYAYDAMNWFIYISQDRRHPLTRNRLSEQELWQLYLTVREQISNIKDKQLLELIKKSIKIYHSKKILLKKEDIKIVKIIPESPLFKIKIKYLHQIIDDLDNNIYKTYDFVYSLIDSRDNKTTILDNLTAIIKIPMNMTIKITF